MLVLFSVSLSPVMDHELIDWPKLCISAEINVSAEASVSAKASAFQRDLFRFRPISVSACFG